jgi:tRNA threonylcarbamoyladenosine biosynthesis protein TsaE
MNNNSLQVWVLDEAEMLTLGSRLAIFCKKRNDAPIIIYLNGSLGAGKTTFARGFLRGFDYTGKVRSPSYTLVEPYELENITVFHFDFYRVKDPTELEFMGIHDYFVPNTVCLIEWPEMGDLPKPDLSCYIDIQGNQRAVTLIADSAHGFSVVCHYFPWRRHPSILPQSK